MYSVLEVIQRNPQYEALDLLHHFEKDLKVDHQVKILHAELNSTMETRNELRILRGKRMEVEERMRIAKSEVDMEVFMTYPPRQGSDAERTKLRLELEKTNEAFVEANAEHKELTRQILEKEDRLEDISIASRNARRVLELFNSYSAFILEYKKGRVM